jgi:hypothetical protein
VRKGNISILSPTATFLAISFASAAVNYVSQSGTATWVQSVDINTPCSLPTANANSSAGDTVYLRGGAYSNIGPINPAHSGISENTRIVYCNYRNEKATIVAGYSISAAGSDAPSMKAITISSNTTPLPTAAIIPWAFTVSTM